MEASQASEAGSTPVARSIFCICPPRIRAGLRPVPCEPDTPGSIRCTASAGSIHRRERAFMPSYASSAELTAEIRKRAKLFAAEFEGIPEGSWDDVPEGRVAGVEVDSHQHRRPLYNVSRQGQKMEKGRRRRLTGQTARALTRENRRGRSQGSWRRRRRACASRRRKWSRSDCA